MADFFTLELDTTGPDITLIAPQYTIPQVETEIWVRASEPLAPYQEFYILDSFGNRYDLIFEYLGDAFRGVYNFNDVPIGICTIYARVKDEVYNLSPLASKAIYVREPAPMVLKVSRQTRQIRALGQVRRVSLDNTVRKVKVKVE